MFVVLLLLKFISTIFEHRKKENVVKTKTQKAFSL